MKKKLDILVTQYKENDDIVRCLLDSIECQVGINKDDIRVIIANDGSDVYLSDKLLSNYNYEIQYIKSQHLGVSGLRNLLLDNSDAEYVMYCDCDDMFFSSFGLFIIFREMNKVDEETGLLGFDGLVSVFKEEVLTEDGGKSYINRDEHDATFVHGKVYRRQYLIDNNIRWNEELTLHEDAYFNCIALASSPYIRYIKNSFYLWRYREGSVTRQGEMFEKVSFEHMMKSSYALINEFLKRGLTRQAKMNVANMLYKIYFSMNLWEKRDIEKEKLTGAFYLKYKYLYDKVTNNEKIELLKKMRNEFYEHGLALEKISFDEFLKNIVK